ncbi:MAG TPA: ABC transporter ATP-binding protein, partial [Gammaproteobacteria bacterium]|nr:ABC transporter ATP-binding protein [Gammaproteobacteria bacterium]
MSSLPGRHAPIARASAERRSGRQALDDYLSFWRYSRRAIALVWSTHRKLTIALGVLTIAAGLMPAAVAYVGKLIVDAVVVAIDSNRAGAAPDYALVLELVALEGALVAVLAGTQRGIGFCQSLLRVLLSQRVNLLILDKALTLTLAQFENSELYDKLNRARQEASVRPLSLVNRTFALAQNAVSLASYAGLLLAFSPWAVAILVAAGLPAFIAETRFSGERFRAFQWRSQDRRMLGYLEIVIAREDHAKEVKLFALGPRLLARFREIFRRIYDEEKRLTLRRDGWGFVLGLVASAAFYGAYVWIAL